MVMITQKYPSMQAFLFTTIFSICTALASCSTITQSTQSQQSLNIKEKAIAVLDSLTTTDRSALQYIDDDKYIQHNPNVATGKQGLIDFLNAIPQHPKQETSDIVRVYVDGSYVFAHSKSDQLGVVAFDIFRFEKGKIVEHWDNIQPLQSVDNPSGHTQTDGATTISETGLTKKNKALVHDLIQEVFIQGKIYRITRYLSKRQLIQHSPNIKDGIAGLAKFLNTIKTREIGLQYKKFHAVLGEQNFVLAVLEGTLYQTPTAFYNLFRVQKGKIVEHWSTLQAIPPIHQQKNTNGLFGFPSSAMSIQ